MKRLILWGIALGLAVGWSSPAVAGPTEAQKCESYKLKQTGKYAFCRMKADSKAVKKGEVPDYTKCDEKITDRFGKAESTWKFECPTLEDAGKIQEQVTADSDFVALKLAGDRFVDNGDQTVTDVDTGLTWEQKDYVKGGIHNVDNLFIWTATGTAPDGNAFTTFLAALNGGTSGDGMTISGCFADHCDWRLPTSAELQTILLEPYPCSTSPCIDPIFGPTQRAPYWSATSADYMPVLAWLVDFADGPVNADSKSLKFCVRAVRGGL